MQDNQNGVLETNWTKKQIIIKVLLMFAALAYVSSYFLPAVDYYGGPLYGYEIVFSPFIIAAFIPNTLVILTVFRYQKFTLVLKVCIFIIVLGSSWFYIVLEWTDPYQPRTSSFLIGYWLWLLSCSAIMFISLFESKPRGEKDIKTKLVPAHSGIKAAIFFHEDDYGQVQILSNQNFDWLMKEAENVQDFSLRHNAGKGFTNVYLRKDEGLKLEERNIKVSEIEEMLSKLGLEKHGIVSTGIRPGEMLSENTFGYGENYNGLFFDFKEDIVSNIWIAGILNVSDAKLIALLNEIGRKWSLVLMDWNSMDLIDLKSEVQIQKYLTN
jgi:hypothetical protein